MEGRPQGVEPMLIALPIVNGRSEGCDRTILRDRSTRVTAGFSR
jgi:hypothetical protein